MTVTSITIGNVTYNAGQAPAVEQDKLMSLLSARLIERAVIMAKQGQSVDKSLVTSMFMAMPQETKSQVSDILLRAVTIAGTTQKVTVQDFGGKMVQYNRLLAELFEWNLSDFFDYLRSVLNVEAVAKMEQEVKSTGS